VSEIFNYDPEKQNVQKTTKQDDYGNYNEKQKLQELRILKKSQLPAKKTNSK